MTEEGLRTGIAWFFGGGFMALSAMAAFANIQRHWVMYRANKAGEFRRISGTPFVTSVFFFLGWWIAPAPDWPWVVLVVLFELPAFITIVPSDYETGAPATSETGASATSETEGEEPPTTTG